MKKTEVLKSVLEVNNSWLIQLERIEGTSLEEHLADLMIDSLITEYETKIRYLQDKINLLKNAK